MTFQGVGGANANTKKPLKGVQFSSGQFLLKSSQCCLVQKLLMMQGSGGMEKSKGKNGKCLQFKHDCGE